MISVLTLECSRSRFWVPLIEFVQSHYILDMKLWQKRLGQYDDPCLWRENRKRTGCIISWLIMIIIISSTMIIRMNYNNGWVWAELSWVEVNEDYGATEQPFDKEKFKSFKVFAWDLATGFWKNRIQDNRFPSWCEIWMLDIG